MVGVIWGDKTKMDVGALKTLLEEAREEVGIKPQQQVDILIHRGFGTYADLINGRNKNPRPELLRDIAQILRLTEAEWIDLNRFATSGDPKGSLYKASGYEVPGGWQNAVDGTNHVAYVMDCAFNLLAYNQAFRDVFHGLTIPRNMLRWMLLHPDARKILGDWLQAWLPYLLAELRSVRAGLADDPTLASIERDVLADRTTLGPLYETGARVHVPVDGNIRPMYHPKMKKDGWAMILKADVGAGCRLMQIMFTPGAKPHTRLPHLRSAS